MSTRFLRAYTEVLVHTCRRREAQAIGGPVAEVPSGLHDDPSTRAQKRVSRDKAREAREGFGGAWVLHPALVPVARAAFSEVARAVRPTTTAPIPQMRMTDTTSLAGNPTLSGLRRNIRVSLRYLTAWFGGQAAVVIDGHVEDIGTVELARLQIWRWSHHEVLLAERLTVSQRLVDRLMIEEIAMLRRRLPGAQARVEMAEQVLSEAIGAGEPPAFLSNMAYAALVRDRADPVADQSAAQSERSRGGTVRCSAPSQTTRCLVRIGKPLAALGRCGVLRPFWIASRLTTLATCPYRTNVRRFRRASRPRLAIDPH
ncbi:hypothetical protein [Ornithinimicrobium sp. INDO-MA30-4]|uniref:hypothetical protein n=1 Tax=Ornithinimicrobium sp. INDO-MA30-4 TaxID=2908651 RepID=UPI001F429397|nr:hypothetical protein [Ornithinimicrobium sp. INDO-MA30-4]UJH71177.1 hypothetical protein L0A91_04905 [Ornithinimicrobium sp. INDO-MA30-4]